MSRYRDHRQQNSRGLLEPAEKDDGFQDLIRLLQKTPPPGNFMSIPDNVSSSSEDEKWNRFKIKMLRKRRKPRKARPPTIRLPDSAVASKTIAGHRHIAISIPLEHSHLARLENSQYPVYHSLEADFQREVENRLGPMRHPVHHHPGTRLRTVREDRESLSSVSMTPKAPSTYLDTISRAQPAYPVVEHLEAPTSAHQHSLPSRKSKGATKRKVASDYEESFPTGGGRLGFSEASRPRPSAADEVLPFRTPDVPSDAANRITSKQKKMAKTVCQPDEAERGRGSSAPAPPSPPLDGPPINLVVPSRSSSRRSPAESRRGEKMDSMVGSPRSSLSGQENANGNGLSIGAHNHARDSFAESLITTESSPKLFKAQTAMAYTTIPIVVRPPERQEEEVESPLYLNFPKPPVQTVDRSVQISTPPPEPPQMARKESRKERVRDRKQRDMDKLKTRMETHQASGPVDVPDTMAAPAPAASRPRSQAVEAGNTWPEPRGSVRFSHIDTPSSSRPASKSWKRSRIPPLSWGPDVPPPMPVISPTAIVGQYQRNNHVSRSEHSVSAPSSPELHGPWEGSAARRTRHRVDAAAATAEDGEATDKLTRQELLQRYESLRDSRMHEMEKRMRRLERNGEVWLRSLGPMMEALNRLLQQGGSDDPSRHLDHHPQQHQPQPSSPYGSPSLGFPPPGRGSVSMGGAPVPVVACPPPRQRFSLDVSSDSLRSMHNEHAFRRSQSTRGAGGDGGSGGWSPRAVDRRRSSSLYGYGHAHGGQGGSGGGGGGFAQTIPRSSHLQEQFEHEMAARRAAEERDAQLDEAMARARYEHQQHRQQQQQQQQNQHQHQQRRRRRQRQQQPQQNHHHRHPHPNQNYYGDLMVPASAAGTEVDAGYSSSRSRSSSSFYSSSGGDRPGRGLEDMEPLMRDITGVRQAAPFGGETTGAPGPPPPLDGVRVRHGSPPPLHEDDLFAGF
ncbi:hypothetical protein GGR56DRAFT_442977 [Xylariaceae sp. FL0804]|nr:hypothetical protein GGR56DRAFT_442977 [Xylariaceae sp. FL0804]